LGGNWSIQKHGYQEKHKQQQERQSIGSERELDKPVQPSHWLSHPQVVVLPTAIVSHGTVIRVAIDFAAFTETTGQNRYRTYFAETKSETTKAPV
jgi:hypothetical protein